AMIARHLIRLTALAVLAYLALPLVVILGASFTATPYLAFPPQGWTLEWYRTLLVEAGYVAAFTTSTVLALAATVAAVLLTVPAALALAAPFSNHEGQDCLAPNRAEDRAAG
ncbi:MAG: hypothetical protein AAGU05_04825, partial [Anaerolineaceae bacterium]